MIDHENAILNRAMDFDRKAGLFETRNQIQQRLGSGFEGRVVLNVRIREGRSGGGGIIVDEELANGGIGNQSLVLSCKHRRGSCCTGSPFPPYISSACP